MDYKNMETEALSAEITRLKGEATEERSLEELQTIESTINEINAEIEERTAKEAERRSIAEAVASGAGMLKEERKEKNMDIEIRNTKEYINAYADYIRTGDDRECRTLLTENGVSGTVAVPEIVYDIVKTAWERNGITSRVRKAYLKGNLKVNFEISATGATTHAEAAEVSEETLVLGTVTLIPANVKKWIGVTDEIIDLRGEEFLRYIYDELAYQIAKKAAEDLLDAIDACGTVGTTTCVGVPVLEATTISVGLIAQAMGLLSGEAENPVIIMNRGTWAAFKAAQAANGFNYDPFEGLPVVFSSHLDSFADASDGDTFAIVGDLERGALMNFPAGEEIKINFDDKTLATYDINRVIGRMFVASAPVASDAFVKIVLDA